MLNGRDSLADLTLVPAIRTIPSCLNVTAHIDHKYGGIATSVPAFSAALHATARYESSLAAFCARDEGASGVGPAVTTYRFGGMRGLFYSPSRKSFESLVLDADLVHIHGLWQEHTRLSASTALRMKKPYMVSAHGMLDPWALRQKRWAKAFYWSLFERRRLERAVCIRALTTGEAHQYRRLGLRAPIAVIPNGIGELPSVDPEVFFDCYPALRGQKVVLFLGRIHNKKGLDLLRTAWRSVAAEISDAHLVIAGPDSDGSGRTTHAYLQEHDLLSRATFTGMLTGNMKWSALKAAHVFVLPSYSEGFSIAVLEAIASGVPVIVTHQCYFPEIAEVRCGWTIDPTTEDLQTAMREALSSTGSERAGMAERGVTLIDARFSWLAIGRQTADVFDWMLGGGYPTSALILK